MTENKLKAVQETVYGQVKETTGKLIGNEELELKGRLQMGVGKARYALESVSDEIEGVKDTVVGGVKEVTGKVTDNKRLQLKGNIQKRTAKGSHTDKIIYGLGIITLLLIIAAFVSKFSKDEEEE